MKFGVVVFPGSNCDQDMIDVLEQLREEHPIQVAKLWHKDHNLYGCDFIVLPGGFSYGDYLRSGAIARFSPVIQEVIEFADKGGFVMGICNGFQIACEAGLLPGVLMHNVHRKFACKNVFIRAERQDTIFTSAIPAGTVLKIPIAHGEGNFYADEKTINELYTNGQVLFRYCDENGTLTDESNPNGAVQNIAGICSRRKNVFGMMPHPERAADPVLGNTDGLMIFNSVLNLVAA